MSSGQGVFIIHRIAGRVRLGVEALRGDPEKAERVAGRARERPCVLDARANPWAGCLTVEHDPGVRLERVLAELGQIPELSDCGSRCVDDLARPRRAPPAQPPDPCRPAKLVAQAAARVNAASCSVTRPELDLKILIPGALVGYGVVRVLGWGGGGPHWITLFKYGFDTFVVLNKRVVQGFLSGPLSAFTNGGKTAP
jgi:hypothetical protein